MKFFFSYFSLYFTEMSWKMMFTTNFSFQHFLLLTHFFPDTDPSVCKHSIVLSHMAICSIISLQFFRYDLVRNYFADTSNPKNILFAKNWVTERVLKLQNQSFSVFSCIYKTWWVHYAHINISNIILKYLFSREQLLKWKLNRKTPISIILWWKKIFKSLKSYFSRQIFAVFVTWLKYANHETVINCSIL